MRRPTLSKRAFVPNSLLDPNTVKKAKKALRFSQVTQDRISHILNNVDLSETEDEYDLDDYHYVINGETVTVNEYRIFKHGVSLPMAYAIKAFPNVSWDTNVVMPQHSIPFTGKITARDGRQEKFFADLMAEADKWPDGPQRILANATTGSGKTVAGIYVGWQLNTPTLIVVDSNKIANGWLKNFRQFFGQAWTDKFVGRAQRDTCEYTGKAFVIAMAQSLASRPYRYEMGFYRNFGLVVVDEIQVFGGPHFSPILYMFNAAVQIGLTAENKEGAFGRLIKSHLGDTKVVSTQEVMRPDAYVLKNELEEPFWCANDGALLTNLSRIPARNLRIANLIKSRGWERGRQVLVLSNRTRQLTVLKEMLVNLGVPEHECGVHAGKYETNRYVLYYKIGNSNHRNRLGVFDTRNQAYTIRNRIERKDYASITMPEALYNRLQLDPTDKKYEEITFETSREVYAPTQNELDNITHSCSIILATYEIFSKGVDVPKLDMGVEALPSGNLKQPLGRVLRIKEGKPTPEWYAVHDFLKVGEDVDPFQPEGCARTKILNAFFTGKTSVRLAALKKAGARIAVQ